MISTATKRPDPCIASHREFFINKSVYVTHCVKEDKILMLALETCYFGTSLRQKKHLMTDIST